MKRVMSVLLVLCALRCVSTHGQTVNTDSLAPAQNFYDMSLEDLMGIEVNVASVHALTLREAPGIITLITEEEIKSSGARDLTDLLKLVPGFDFGVDVEGVVGLAVRGNWAHEGKALLLIDGLEMNENLFSTLQFGNHYPISDIKKIEIIRGPGSAVYGGNAEYAVINIITKSPSDLTGSEIKVSYGLMDDIEAGNSINVSSGKQFGRFGYSVNYFGSSAIRSNQRYNDFYDGSYDMTENSDLLENFLNISLNYNKLQFRGIIDKYTVESRDNYDVITSRSYAIKFDSYIGELKREFQVLKNLAITPRLNFKLQLPWNYNDEIVNEEINPFDISSTRYTGAVATSYDPSLKLNISGGIEYFYDKATQLGDEIFISTNNKNLTYSNTAIFGQASLKTKIANITAGARYNRNERFASSFVPRISITRVINRVHFKLLYSQAYRTPNTQNIDLNPAIQPEKTTVIEFESGVKIGRSFYLTGNLFDITTKDPIVFYYNNESDQDLYENSDETGTQGVEFDFQWKFKNGYVDLGYGYYSAVNKNRLSDYKVPDEPHSLLGLSNQKLSMSALLKISGHWSVSPTLVMSGVKYGTVAINDQDETVIGKYDPTLLLNIALRAEDLLTKGLSMSLALHNILDANEQYLQPYNGGHAPLPGTSRQVSLSVSYKFLYK